MKQMYTISGSLVPRYYTFSSWDLAKAALEEIKRGFLNNGSYYLLYESDDSFSLHNEDEWQDVECHIKEVDVIDSERDFPQSFI